MGHDGHWGGTLAVQVGGKITRRQTPERTLFLPWGAADEMGGTVARDQRSLRIAS